MELISNLAAVIAPVILVTLAGYVWGRRSLSFDHGMVTRLVSDLAAPALVFSTLSTMQLSPDQLTRMGSATVLSLGLFALGGTMILKVCRLPIRVYLPSLMFPNIGNMGLPVCLFAFGQHGLALGMIFFAVTSIGQFAIGPAIAAGRLDMAAMARVPLIHAVVVAVAINLAGIPVPRWISNTTSLVGGMAIPLMLLSLGVALAELRAASLGRALAMSAVRLGMGMAVGWGVAAAFGFTGAERGVTVLQCSMPVAVFNFLFARLHGNNPEEVAGMIMVSTVLSYLLLPLVVAAVM